MLSFLPAVMIALAHPAPARAELATILASADSIDWVVENDPTISFGIERGGAELRVTVALRDDGELGALDVTPTGVARRAAGTTGVLTWLAAELRDASIARLAIEPDGDIAITTRDGRHYLALPSRAGGNGGVEARWAAEWDR